MRDSILYFYVATMSKIDSEPFGRVHLLRVVAVVSPCVPAAPASSASSSGTSI